MFRAQSGLEGIKVAVEECGNYYFQVLRYHDIWKSLFIKKQYQEENYKSFGFRCTVSPYQGGEYMKETTEQKKITDFVLNYMKKIKELCDEKGAKKVTSYLGMYLKSKYELPDHRNDVDYAGWTKELKKYGEREKQHLKEMFNSSDKK